jgi:hypothetical protein
MALGGAVVACTGILGIDDYKGVDCAHPDVCGDTFGFVPETGDAGEAEADVGSAMEGGPDVTFSDVVVTPEASLFWARWQMPNPANTPSAPALDGSIDGPVCFAEASLPNPASYDASLGMGDAGIATVFDAVTKLTWEREGNNPAVDAVTASNYCMSLLGGGWRLPTRIELVSIIDFTLGNPAIDPIFANTKSAGYWSSSPPPDDSGMNYWVVAFDDGSVKVGGGSYVRCVRSGP